MRDSANKIFTKRFRWLALAMIALLGLLTFKVVYADRSALLQIATLCADPTTPNYCSICPSPRVDTSCGAENSCKKSTEVWQLNNDFVSIRDIKMCGCGEGFVHGLTMPRVPNTGVEDPKRPNAIWDFAWKTGVEKIPESELALVVNPQKHRSQDQLHLHLLRYAPDKKDTMLENLAGYTNDLSQVWSIAQNYARQKGLEDFGVLVFKPNDFNNAGYAVIVKVDSPEGAYTIYRCDTKKKSVIENFLN